MTVKNGHKRINPGTDARTKAEIRVSLKAMVPRTELGRKMINASLKVLDSETPLLTIDEINQKLGGYDE
jgi:hypothetical protein